MYCIYLVFHHIPRYLQLKAYLHENEEIEFWLVCACCELWADYKISEKASALTKSK